MNNRVPHTAESLIQSEDTDGQQAHQSFYSRPASIILKIVLTILGTGFGAFIGLIIALTTGLVTFNC